MDNAGEERWNRAWRFKSLAESGARLAFSSDWQVGEMDPLVGFYTALILVVWSYGEEPPVPASAAHAIQGIPSAAHATCSH